MNSELISSFYFFGIERDKKMEEGKEEKKVIKKFLMQTSKEELEKIFRLPGCFIGLMGECLCKDNLKFLEDEKGIVIDKIPVLRRKRKFLIMEETKGKVDLEKMMLSSNTEDKAIALEHLLMIAMNEDIGREMRVPVVGCAGM